jgi:hypothetical protein
MESYDIIYYYLWKIIYKYFWNIILIIIFTYIIYINLINIYNIYTDTHENIYNIKLELLENINKKQFKNINNRIELLEKTNKDINTKIKMIDKNINNKIELLDKINSLYKLNNSINDHINLLNIIYELHNNKINNLKASITSNNTNIKEIIFNQPKNYTDNNYQYNNHLHINQIDNELLEIFNKKHILLFDDIKIITINITCEAIYLVEECCERICKKNHHTTFCQSTNSVKTCYHHMEPIINEPENFTIPDTFKYDVDTIIKMINNNNNITINIVDKTEKIIFPYHWFNYLFDNINIKKVNIINFQVYQKEYINKYVLSKINNELKNKINLLIIL